MRIIADARIKQGRLEFKQRSSFLTDVEKLRDGEYIVTVERARRKRSIDQNRYYWGVVVPLVKEGLTDIGYRLTTEAVHEFLKGQFNIVEIVNEKSGEIMKSIGSTTEMSTSQMMDYFSKIKEWASEYLSVYIPDPNEQLSI